MRKLMENYRKYIFNNGIERCSFDKEIFQGILIEFEKEEHNVGKILFYVINEIENMNFDKQYTKIDVYHFLFLNIENCKNNMDMDNMLCLITEPIIGFEKLNY